MSSPKGTILVTGGTGKVGLCIAKLCETSSTPYLVASRSASSATASTIHPTVKFDWLDRTTWSNPFITATKSSQITAVYLISPPVFDASAIMNDFIDLARKEYGVKRFVLQSATSVEAGGPVFGGTARYLQELGAGGEVGFGVMRPTWFMENWAEQGSLRETVRAESRAYSASGPGRIPWVSKTDIAACAYEALAAEEAPNGDYVILGPELLSYGECANVLSEVTGKKVVHVNLTVEELAEHHVKSSGIGEDYARVLAAMDIPIKNGSEEKLNDVVLRVTGREPKTFREFALENKSIWL
ncbi:putative agroclavine dehydrogenase [Diaporthe ampelina]|uniref:Putative agroclavine dehydrogenase n=1 Tax=Diaporthe ampelina TaxID=1214573 RepID=A0A0G2FA91_9PEZI|nr:putative agroclavine dehydrogenase [Diaporthe ampelina]